MICPNKAHPDWKALVSKHGESKAYDIFVKNDYSIPESKKENRGQGFDSFGSFFKSSSTLDTLESNPKLANEIIDDLKRLFPEVKIYKDGIFNENGTYREIAPGEKGMFYRHAFNSAVAWASDSYLETPPHEYAHHYIEMFREHPMVAEAINEYGEENLVEYIGRYYTKQKVDAPIKTWIERFFRMMKSLFGHQDVRTKLAESFIKGERLTPEVHQGTSIYRFQEKVKPLKRAENNIFDNEGKYDNAKEQINKIPLSDYIASFRNDFKSMFGSVDVNREDMNNYLRKEFNSLVESLKKNDLSSDGKYANTQGLDERFLSDVNEAINDPEQFNAIFSALHSTFTGNKEALNNSSAEVKNALQSLLNFYAKANQRLDYLNQTRNKVILKNGVVVDKKYLLSDMSLEIEKTKRAKEKFYKSVEEKFGKKVGPSIVSFFKKIENLLQAYQLNARVQSKFLSGSEESTLSKVLYKSFNKAFHDKNRIIQNVNKIYDKNDLSDFVKKGSKFFNKNANISQMATKTFELRLKNGGIKNVDLTNAEILSLYLNLRQEDSAKTISEKGFLLDDSIDGRNFQRDTAFKLSEENIAEINNFVESSEEFSKIVEKFDKTFTYLHGEINETYKQEAGTDLERVLNYFPVSQGISKDEQRRSLKNVDYLKSSKARLGQSKPVRINDPFSVVSNAVSNSAHYTAYAVPIRNAKMILKDLKLNYENEFESKYIDSLSGNVERLQDSSQLYSSESENKFVKWVNKRQNEFSVAVLGMNIPVMFKQPVSYLTAKEEIDVKFLQKAGWGIGGIAGINFKDIMKSMKYTGVKGGVTILPIEWRADKNNDVYQNIMKYSPILSERFEGQIDREVGETKMDSFANEDIIELPFSSKLNKLLKGNDENFKLSKNRMMEGIKVFDTATVMAIWKAAEYEAEEKYGLSRSNEQEFYDHVAIRTEEIVNKTQPTFDLNNRSALSSLGSPFARFLTMFSSARSKVAILMIEGAVDLMNNPTKAGWSKFAKRMINLSVLSAATITAIDVMKHFLSHGYDDDDPLSEDVVTRMLSNNTGLFFGIGPLSDFVVSTLDSKPWHKSINHPLFIMAEDLGAVVSKTLKGDIGDAALKSIELTAKFKGLPLSPYLNIKNGIERVSE